jgi:type II secretory pathway component PulJ
MVLIVLIILVAAIILNSYMQRKEANRREYEHERRQERFERLMDLLQKSNSDKENEQSIAKDGDDPDSYRDKS